MRNPISGWTKERVEFWRRQSLCVGKSINHAFTDADRQAALNKLSSLYPVGRVYPKFADTVLLASELYDFPPAKKQKGGDPEEKWE